MLGVPQILRPWVIRRKASRPVDFPTGARAAGRFWRESLGKRWEPAGNSGE